MSQPAPRVSLEIVCPAEDVLLARLVLPERPATRLTTAVLRRHLQRVADDREPLTGRLKDGTQMLCPACGNAVLLRRQGQDLDQARADDFRVLVGHTIIDPARAVKLKARDHAQHEPNPLRVQPIITPAD
jgi:hypothetical protein